MANPDENNNQNNSVKNKQKEGKEFVQENETHQQKGVNVEEGYQSNEVKPVSVNYGDNESRAVGNDTSKKTSNLSMDWAGAKKQEKYNSSSMGGNLSDGQQARKKNSNTSGSGNLSEDPKINASTQPNQNNNLSGDIGTEPKDYVAETPEVKIPKVDAPTQELTDTTKKTTDSDTKKQDAATSGDSNDSGDPKKEAPKEKKEEPKIAVSEELKKIIGVIGEDSSKEDNVSTESADEEGAKKTGEAIQDIAAENKLDNTPTNTNETASGETTSGQTTTTNTEAATTETTKEDPNAAALAAFDVEETGAEKEEDAKVDKIASEARNRGLMVGRSIGYGAMIAPTADEKFSITKFSESDDPVEEAAAKDKYNQANDQIAKNMEQYGTEEVPEGGEVSPKKGYLDAYFQGYNEGHREGTALKAEAAAAERTDQMNKEKGTDEYLAGMSLGMICGVLTAKGEKDVDTTFTIKKEGKPQVIPVKTTVADLDSAAFDRKQTPGGELSGPAYEKAFLLHYNIGYREGQNQRTQPPPMDDDYKLGHEQGYKLGTQKGKGEAGDEDLLALETTYDAKDEQTLEKDELQQYRGFYAGYNKGYRQVQDAKKNKAKTEREEKNKDSTFVSGYSTGNLKGFLTAMIEPSGIDLAEALKSTAKMEAAGIPDYFPIPDELRKNILAVLKFGENVPENDNEEDERKRLIGKPLFKEGLLFGYNRGYGQGQKSRSAFARDKHKMHPDYQRSVLVLMPSDESTYTGPVGDDTFVKGFTMGQILANAQFEINQLRKKQSQSEKDKKRLADLSKAVAGLNGVIGKESSFYKSGVDEFYTWWMGILAKKAQEDKVKYGYSGEEGSVKRKGFEWGMKVGAEVIKGKEKIKEINRKGRDITARNAHLNDAIKKSEADAKATSKSKGGEEYYIGYRNGYNNAFRAAKQDKKSNKGNLGTENTLENAGTGLYSDEILGAVKKAGIDISIDKNALSVAVTNASAKFGEKTKKAFEDGLARGYNSGYSANVFDVATGKVSEDSKKQDETHIQEQYKVYQKLEKGGEDSTKNLAFGVLYFFLVAYQYHKKDEPHVKHGLPKGIADAKSFNLGYKAVVESSGGSGKLVDRSGEAEYIDAYNAGYNAAKYQVRYATFKKMMVRSVVDKNKEVKQEEVNSKNSGTETQEGTNSNSKNSGTETQEGTNSNSKNSGTDTSTASNPSSVDEELTGGLSLLLRAEELDSVSEKTGDQSKFYKEGYKSATLLWTKIIYMRSNVKFEGINIPETVTIHLLEDHAATVAHDESSAVHEESEEDHGSVTIEDDEKGVKKANEYYSNPDEVIQKIANNYVVHNYSKDSSPDKPEFEEAKQKFIAGYKAKIELIKSGYKERLIENWLHDTAYYNAIKQVAPNTEIKEPNAPPYDGMSSSEIDTSSPEYQKGYLEGLRIGNLIKTGIIKPSNTDLAKASGDEYSHSFQDGTKAGSEKGKRDAKPPVDPPSRKVIVARLTKKYKEQNRGVDDTSKLDQYGETYIDAYFLAYWESRNYEYGRLLGYERGAEGGDDMFNSEPEKGISIDDNKDAFYRGFQAGRDRGASGLPEDNLGRKKGRKKRESYGEDYAEMLKGGAAHELDKNQREGTGETGLDEPGRSALEILQDLLFGGIQDFYLDELLLLDIFYALETKVEDVQHHIEVDLEEIELNRALIDLSTGNELEEEFKELARLEKELENKSLGEGEKASLDLRIIVLKSEIGEKRAKSQQIQHDWQSAEAAAKKKIDSIRILMRDDLSFDTPLKSNEDILKYIKINLESSKGNKEDIYGDIDIFNDLTLRGAFKYEESKNIDVSILGDANFHLDHYAENVHIENAEILMAENGFEFKARGLSYVKDDNELTFMSGSIVTPSIEGGAHMGEQYKYNFEDFNVYLGQGIKSQIDAQKYKLKGGTA
jgi:hypothetical protein